MIIDQQYKAVKAGTLTKEQFIQEAKWDSRLAKYITNFDTFEDVINTFKSKGLLFEDEAPAPKKFSVSNWIKESLTDEINEPKGTVHPEHVSAFEFEKGWRYELKAIGKYEEEDVRKAKEKAIKNIEKDAIHYTKIEMGENVPDEKGHKDLDVSKGQNKVDADNQSKPVKTKEVDADARAKEYLKKSEEKGKHPKSKEALKEAVEPTTDLPGGWEILPVKSDFKVAKEGETMAGFGIFMTDNKDDFYFDHGDHRDTDQIYKTKEEAKKSFDLSTKTPGTDFYAWNEKHSKGKETVKEAAEGEEDIYSDIEDQYGEPEIMNILKDLDYLGFDLPGEAVNAILVNKNFAKDFDITDANDVAKLKAWRAKHAGLKESPLSDLVTTGHPNSDHPLFEEECGCGDKLPGGVGDETSPYAVDQQELAMGIKHESEHTNDPAIAMEIALDHLTEDPHYYSNLKAAGIEDEAVAMNIIKEAVRASVIKSLLKEYTYVPSPAGPDVDRKELSRMMKGVDFPPVGPADSDTRSNYATTINQRKVDAIKTLIDRMGWEGIDVYDKYAPPGSEYGQEEDLFHVIKEEDFENVNAAEAEAVLKLSPEVVAANVKKGMYPEGSKRYNNAFKVLVKAAMSGKMNPEVRDVYLRMQDKKK